MDALRCKKTDLPDHWASVRLLLARIAGLDPNRLRNEAGGGGLEQSIAWADDRDETAQRNLGTATRVIPLDENSYEGRVPGWWLSWHEKWRPVGLKRTVEFDSTSITFFFGLRRQRKLQVLRAEWVGPDTSGDYDGKHAAHPHWHIDAPVWAAAKELGLPTASASPFPIEENDGVFLEEESAGDTEVLPADTEGRDFGAFDIQATLDLSRLHLAMIATWQTKRFVPPSTSLEAHQASPESIQMIQNWLSSTCAYAALELRRAAK